MFSYNVSTATSIVFFSSLTYTFNENILIFQVIHKNLRELIQINIELKDRNPLKEFFHRLHSKLEDILFSIIEKLPEKLIPSALMNWLERYLDKRIRELKQQTIKQTWQNMYLQEAVDNIHNRQQDTKKTPSDD